MRRWLWLAVGLFIVASGLVSAQVVPTTQTTFAGLAASRLTSSGTAPTCAVTGFGSTGSCAVTTGSTDAAGTLTLTSGGVGQAALGTVTLTYTTGSGAYGTNATSCTATLKDNGVAWNVRATIIGSTGTTTSHVWKWDNNAVNASSTSDVEYVCFGR